MDNEKGLMTCQTCLLANVPIKSNHDCLAEYLSKRLDLSGLCYFCLLPRQLGDVALHSPNCFGSPECPFYKNAGTLLHHFLGTDTFKDLYPSFSPYKDRWAWLFGNDNDGTVQDSNPFAPTNTGRVGIGLCYLPRSVRVALDLLKRLEMKRLELGSL
jgi:hypothetical protein